MWDEYALPSLYAPWIASLLPGGIPRETNADCENCSMCQHDSDTTVSGLMFFDPRLKCCSYEPRLPNFLVGRVLSDSLTDPAGLATLEQRIARRVAVTPLGLDQSGRFDLLYKGALHGFGRALELRCPHYIDAPEGGRCGVWRHRNSVCSTWFCKHLRGAVGYAFWGRLRDLLSYAEDQIALWCALEHGAGSADLLQLGEKKPAQMDLSELGGPPDTAKYDRLWGSWAGREKEYFEACGRAVDALDWESVLRIGGQRLRLLAQLTVEAYERLMSDEIPDRLRLKNLQVEGVQNGKLRLMSYSGFDLVQISERLASALHYFTGQPREDALQAIEANLKLKLSPGLLRRLVDFEILSSADQQKE